MSGHTVVYSVLALCLFVTALQAHARGERLEEPQAASEPGEEPGQRRSSGFEADISMSTSLAGASSAYLRPGPSDPEAMVVLHARPSLGWRAERLDVRLTYAPTLHRHVLAGVTGMLHDVDLAARFQPVRGLTLQSLVFAGQAHYKAKSLGEGGPAGEEATIPLLATRSGAFGFGGGLGYASRERWGLRGGALVTRRSSEAVFARESPVLVEELFIEMSGLIVLRPSRRVELSFGPVSELRSADREYLAYRGAGLQASTVARLWTGGGIEVSTRAQRNSFDGSSARVDLFSRSSLVVWHELRRVRLSGRYSFIGNGSALAAYDADRHLFLMTLAARSPTWRS